MSQTTAVIEELDDWEVLCSFLPEGWKGKARESGALTRARGVADAPALLRTLIDPYRDGVFAGGDLGAGPADGVGAAERGGGVQAPAVGGGMVAVAGRANARRLRDGGSARGATGPSGGCHGGVGTGKHGHGLAHPLRP